MIDDALVCPRCHLAAALGDTCPRCELPLVPRADLPPWGLRARLETRPIVTPRGAITFGLSTLFALGVSLMFLVGGARGGAGVDLLFRAAGLTSLIAIVGVFASQLAGGAREAGRTATARAGLLREAAGLPDVSAATSEAVDGARVRVEGSVRVERPTVTHDGTRCAAWQRVERDGSFEAEGSEAGPSVTVRARGGPPLRLGLYNGTEARTAAGGVFAVELDSGERVRVLAEHVALVDDGVVAEGDRVSVAGFASSTAPEGVAAHHRASARAVELTGTATQPVVIRALPRPAIDARSRVRVEGAVEPAEPTEATRAAEGARERG